MGESRLSGLVTLLIHNELQIDLDEVVTIYTEMGPRRLEF